MRNLRTNKTWEKKKCQKLRMAIDFSATLETKKMEKCL